MTGASTVTLGANAAGAGIVNVITGTGATGITDSNGVTLDVNAAALANNTALTLIGSAAEVIAGLIGNITAGSLTGALTVTTGDATDNTISITIRLGGDLDHRQLQHRYRDGQRDRAGAEYGSDTDRFCGRGGDRAGRGYRGWLPERCADGDDGQCG